MVESPESAASIEADGSVQLTRQALVEATHALAAVSATPRLDAELLMASAFGSSRDDVLLRRLDEVVPTVFLTLLARRMAHEPVAYITGTRSFWTLDLIVTPDVLIPRPDSETLIEAACVHVQADSRVSVLDLGTGSGALLLAALDEWPYALGVGVDKSTKALAVARRNALHLGLSQRADFVQGDWAATVSGRFDVIFCNPPYIEVEAELAQDVADYEPASALYAGADGLDDYRRIIPQLPGLLLPQGRAYLEVGAGQSRQVAALAAQHDMQAAFANDLAGHERCVILSL